MPSILFVCTGNYYRSRFAEIYFNHLAALHTADVSACSRGLEATRLRNPGPISQHALRFLEQKKIPLPEPVRFPEQFRTLDFRAARQTILLDETEHRPMMERYHPELAGLVTYWSFPDMPVLHPDVVLPELEKKVIDFFQQILTV